MYKYLCSIVVIYFFCVMNAQEKTPQNASTNYVDLTAHNLYTNSDYMVKNLEETNALLFQLVLNQQALILRQKSMILDFKNHTHVPTPMEE